jgi:hypothetical protein
MLKRQLKYFLTLIIGWLLASCATTPPKLPSSAAQSFFAPNATWYLVVKPRYLPLQVINKQSNNSTLKALMPLLNRTHSAQFYGDSLQNFTGFLEGGFPKGFIEQALSKDSAWIKTTIDLPNNSQPTKANTIRQTFTNTQFNIELALPQNNNLFVARGQNLASINQNQPNAQSFLSSSLYNALFNNELTFYTTQPLSLLTGSNIKLPPITPQFKSLMFSLSRKKPLSPNFQEGEQHFNRHYLTLNVTLETESARYARATASLLRTLRLAVPHFNFLNEMEIDTLDTLVLISKSVTHSESEALLTKLATLLPKTI